MTLPIDISDWQAALQKTLVPIPLRRTPTPAHKKKTVEKSRIMMRQLKKSIVNKDWNGTREAIEKGCPIDTLVYAKRTTALFFWALAGNEKAVQWLLDNGASVHHVDRTNCPLLFYAARSKNFKVFTLIFEASPHSQNFFHLKTFNPTPQIERFSIWSPIVYGKNRDIIAYAFQQKILKPEKQYEMTLLKDHLSELIIQQADSLLMDCFISWTRQELVESYCIDAKCLWTALYKYDAVPSISLLTQHHLLPNHADLSEANGYTFGTSSLKRRTLSQFNQAAPPPLLLCLSYGTQ